MRWFTDRRVRSLQESLRKARSETRVVEKALRDARDELVEQEQRHVSEIETMQNALLDEERDHAKTREALEDLERITFRGAA